MDHAQINHHPVLDQAQLHGIKMGLTGIQTVLREFGNPEKSIPSVHLAGTNGKGSCSEIIAQSLINCGYRTAQFQSPHIRVVNERFKINGQNIPDSKLDELLGQIQDVQKKLMNRNKIQPLTYFEICTVCAFLYFKQEHVDWMIIETGMGGRLDSTNVIHSSYVVISSLSIDHTKYLGESIQSIAKEKAGIIHPDSSIILGSMPHEQKQWFLNQFQEHEILIYQDDFRIQNQGNQYQFTSHDLNLSFEPSLKAHYQINNMACSLACLFQIHHQYPLDASKIKKTLENIRIKGRFDRVHDNPLIIIDAAHNQNGIDELLLSMKTNVKNKTITALCAFSKDKPYIQMIDQLLTLCEHIHLIPIDHPRLISPEEILHSFEKNPHYTRLSIPKDIHSTLSTLISQKDQCILICGSFFLLERAYAYFDYF